MKLLTAGGKAQGSGDGWRDRCNLKNRGIYEALLSQVSQIPQDTALFQGLILPEVREPGMRKTEEGRQLIALLEKELAKKYDGYTNASLIVKELVKKAREGDKAVGMWVFDRLYGKPTESKKVEMPDLFKFFPKQENLLDEFKPETGAIEIEAEVEQ